MRTTTKSTNRIPRTQMLDYAAFFTKLSEATPKPPKKELYTAAFVNCCGINIIWGFPGTDTSGYGRRNDMFYKHVIEEIEEKIKGSVGYGLTLAALNDDQVALWDEHMQAAGLYPLVKDFYHTGHGHKITLYGHVHHPEGGKKKGKIPIEISGRHRDEQPPQS